MLGTSSNRNVCILIYYVCYFYPVTDGSDIAKRIFYDECMMKTRGICWGKVNDSNFLTWKNSKQTKKIDIANLQWILVGMRKTEPTSVKCNSSTWNNEKPRWLYLMYLFWVKFQRFSAVIAAMFSQKWNFKIALGICCAIFFLWKPILTLILSVPQSHMFRAKIV